MSLNELEDARKRMDRFRADWAESPLWCTVESLALLRKNGALYYAEDPMMTAGLETWWKPEMLLMDAVDDPEGDELVMLVMAPNARWLKLYVNGGSGIPFGMFSIEEIPEGI